VTITGTDLCVEDLQGLRGTCQVPTLNLNDGTSYTANFKYIN
jgi:hypothetical protein